ncbi:MAG: stage sporulation protein [Paenibacillus sp.]|nr:stage sporulation protein [Paenibacillus sp.]
MVKRVSFRPYIFVAFALMVMMFCWESNRIQAAILDSSIPEDAIRIRILANSDTPQDQWIKRQVQNEVVQEISTWVLDPSGLEEARAAITANIPAIESLVGEVLANNGYDQAYQVELGQVSFPAKQFGNKSYPEGQYEALRIVLGKGEGQNWWCVLFPPLCFVGVKAKAAEASSIEAVPAGSAAKNGKSNAKAAPTDKSSASNVKTASASIAKGKPSAAASETSVKQTAPAAGADANLDDNTAPKAEVKFFLWEVTKKVTMKVKSLFA